MEIGASDLFGTLGTLMQFILIFTGKPHQAYLMWKNQSSENVSVYQYMVIVLACVSYLVYGLLESDPYIYLPQVPALFFLAIIIGLWFRYRHPKNETVST